MAGCHVAARHWQAAVWQPGQALTGMQGFSVVQRQAVLWPLATYMHRLTGSSALCDDSDKDWHTQ